MTGQQAIDFINAYEPVETLIGNKVEYNAIRCGNMAKDKYGLTDYETTVVKIGYILHLAEKR